MADTTQKILTLINNNRKYRPWGLGKNRPREKTPGLCVHQTATHPPSQRHHTTILLQWQMFTHIYTYTA